MTDQKETVTTGNKALTNHYLLLELFADTSLKLAQAMNQQQSFGYEDIKALERLGKNIQVLHGLLFD